LVLVTASQEPPYFSLAVCAAAVAYCHAFDYLIAAACDFIVAESIVFFTHLSRR